jgi:hypothetical protein
MQSRRTALAAIAGATASVALGRSLDPPRAAPYLNAKDFKSMETLVDLIIPRTETPGALDADVPYRIDRQVATRPELQDIFAKGLATLSPDFPALPRPQQVSILEAMSESPGTPAGEFFQSIKGLTIDWYYRSEQGLVEELGFNGNTFRRDFPGCTHPEHWPLTEKA